MIRKARLCDVNTIHRILNEYGNKGELLPRPLSKIYDHLRDFSVYTDEKNGDILGCCSLQFCWDDLAEIRSLAVHPEHIRNKIGTQLVSDALQDACRYKVKNVFTLTYRPGFFEKFGFNVIDRAKLPLKIWSDCILCVKFPDCDETAMLKKM